MNTYALFTPGRGPLYRVPAGVKLVALILAASVLVLKPTLPVVAGLAAVTAAGYGSTRLPAVFAWAALRPVLPFLVVIALFQGWTHTIATAALVVAAIAVLVLAASLVSFTTRTTELLDALRVALGPARRIGVDPDRVALQLALGMRAVPLVIDLASTVRDAQRARGLGWSARAFAVPVLVRAIDAAESMAEALAARGIED